MGRTHAFGDDALGDRDAVGLVDALRAGEVSAAELVEAAIARTEAVNPTLNGLVGLKPSRGRLPLEKQAAQMPLHLVANGVLTRTVRDTAAFLREAERIHRNPKLPPIGDVTHAGSRRLNIAVCTESIVREASSEFRELTLKTAALLEELGHKVTEIKNPVPQRLRDDFLLYWQFLSYAIVRGGRRMIGPSFDPAKLDNLTRGLERAAARNLHKVPLAIARLSASRRITARLSATYDAVLMPTLADDTPPIGHLDPTASYDQVMDRLLNWASFTPLHNATGDPAISLPLATSAAGLPVGMMFATIRGREARLLELAYELEEARPFKRIDAG